MINSNIIVKMEMNFALSPKCHFMVMNSISMKMSIEAQPLLKQHTAEKLRKIETINYFI